MQESVLNFWFNELTPKQWWQKSPELDEAIRERFHRLHQQASAGELYHWRSTANGALAEVLVLDQFSRNMYRDHPMAFATDALALALAQTAIEKGFDTQLEPTERAFLYMPFMHSESALIHQQAVALFTALGMPNNLEYEYRHKAIIDRFGRYPHRNAILGRESTQEEQVFLTQAGSHF